MMAAREVRWSGSFPDKFWSPSFYNMLDGLEGHAARLTN